VRGNPPGVGEMGDSTRLLPERRLLWGGGLIIRGQRRGSEEEVRPSVGRFYPHATVGSNAQGPEGAQTQGKELIIEVSAWGIWAAVMQHSEGSFVLRTRKVEVLRQEGHQARLELEEVSKKGRTDTEEGHIRPPWPGIERGEAIHSRGRKDGPSKGTKKPENSEGDRE